MEDYQREKLNKMLRTTTEDEIKWSGRMKANPNNLPLAQRMAECNGRKNGMIEMALTLGYSIKYIDSIPQIV